MSDIRLLLGHLHQPEYLHVLLNPMPVYGMAAGAFMLIISLLRQERDSSPILSWLVLVAIVTGFVFHYGEKGYDRVLAMSNAEARDWLDVHMHRAEMLVYFFYIVGVTAVASLLARKRRPKIGRTLEWVTAILALISVGLGGWISQAGGQVRHSEFREGSPTAAQLLSAREYHDHHE